LEAALAGEPRGRESVSGRLVPSEDPDVIVEIQRVDGVEGRRLRARQAQVLREVIAWLAQSSSNDGRRQQQAA
jgi:hypothetical protein